MPEIFKLLGAEGLVGLGGVLMLVLEAIGPKTRRVQFDVAIWALILAAVADVLNWDVSRRVLGGSYVVDDMGVFFKALLLLVTIVAMLVSREYVERHIRRPGEFFILFMFVCLGMLFIVSANDLITIFISIELISMPMYVLAASQNYNQRSTEAGLKFFILGALSSAFYLLGASLLYGCLQTIYIDQFPQAMQAASGDILFPVYLGLICIMAAFGFKIAAAPFHMWAPDVYEGAPTPVTAFLSTGPKAAEVAILTRILLIGFRPQSAALHLQEDWVLVLSVLSLLSMTVGNLVAMHQTNIKRMMAYSSIAHMGYVLTGLAAASRGGSAAIMFYLFIYTLTALGAWAVVLMWSDVVESDEIRDMAGMSRRAPGLALILMLSMLSLAGLPPLGGFIGKFYLFASAWDAGLKWLAIIGILNSVASLFYYMGVLRVVYFERTDTEEPIAIHPSYAMGLALSTVGIVVLGLVPGMSHWAWTVAASVMAHT